LIVIGVSAVLAFSGLAYQVLDFTKAAGGEQRSLSEFSEADLAKLYAPGAHVQNPDGKLTIIEFGDLVCPQCKGMFPKLSDLIQRSQGRIRYDFRHHPLYQLEEHKFALPAAAISELCAEKGKFWQFVTDCYSGDPSAPEPGLEDMLAFAKSLGVDPDVAAKRIQDENDPAFKKVLDDMNLGNHFGIHATPTFFVIAPGVKPQAIIGPKLLQLLQQPEYQAFLK
jgi:protein-disulfide isomerase